MKKVEIYTETYLLFASNDVKTIDVSDYKTSTDISIELVDGNKIDLSIKGRYNINITNLGGEEKCLN